MNKTNKRSAKTNHGPCLCQTLGDLFRQLGPPEPARRHFDAARVEFLKGLRAILDARIDQVSKAGSKGQKISVE